jgi:UPF0755 protein
MKKAKRWIFGFFLLLFLAAGGAAAYGWYLLNAPYKGYNQPRIAITINEGSSVNSICRLLSEKGVIWNPWLLKGIFLFNKTQKQSKAGDYVFDRALTPFQVYEKLLKGEMYYNFFTVPEGSTVFDIDGLWRIKASQKDGDFKTAIQSPEVLSSLHSVDPALSSAEGFLFPNTYFLGKKDGAEKLAELMLREFKKQFGEAESKRAKELGMSILQVVTLASMIEKETALDNERPLISAVFHNRLHRSMLLQCDPTVIYAMKIAGEYNGNIRKSDLERDSPYNTYVYPGLPPGPICNPGKSAIHAALYPEQTNLLYFVSKNDGSHYFSATLEEHKRAVQQYQRHKS